MDKSHYLSIVWSSLIICKFQVYTDSILYPKYYTISIFYTIQNKEILFD